MRVKSLHTAVQMPAIVRSSCAYGRIARRGDTIRAVVDGQHHNDGTWTIRPDGAVCIDWRDWAWGKNPCHWIKQQGEMWIIERIDDSKNFVRVKRIEGNVNKL